MIVSTKKRSTKFNSDKFHRAYGIQNWLCSKGYCLIKGAKYKVDGKRYKELLKEFCLSQPGFDVKKVKSIETYENYIQKRFPKFCSFCIDKFNPKKTINISITTSGSTFTVI